MPVNDGSANNILYGEQTERTLANMSFSGVRLADFPEFIIALARVKKACALANRRADELDAARCEAVLRACDRLIAGEHRDQFPVDVYHGGGGIGLNMNVNEVLAALAGPDVDPVDHVNMSQSTSDVCHTAMRLALEGSVGALLAELERVCGTLREKAERFAEVMTIARTCWQDGMRVGAGIVFSGAASALDRRRARLADCRAVMRRVNLGATVIGTGTGASDAYRAHVVEALREVTGLDLAPVADPHAAAQYPDDLADLSAEIRLAAEVAAKLARDLRLLSSGPQTGLGELRLPAVQAGSSFFPGKVNPVIPEMVIQCAMLIAGNDSVIQGAVGQGEVHLNLWEEMMGFLLLENCRRLAGALAPFRERCLSGVEINAEVCAGYARSDIPLIVDYKERYGYRNLAERIKKEGLERVVRSLKNQD